MFVLPKIFKKTEKSEGSPNLFDPSKLIKNPYFSVEELLKCCWCVFVNHRKT